MLASQVIFVQLRQFCDAKAKASEADLAVFDICLSEALSEATELLLALVLQVQFASNDVGEDAAILVEAIKIKPVPINNDEILFIIVLPLVSKLNDGAK